MNKLEKKYTDAFHNFLGKTVKPEHTTCTHSGDSYVITNQAPVECQSITGVFFRQVQSIKVAETDYDTSCRFQLRHVSDSELEYLFQDNNYNYDLAKKLVDDLFKIGQKFKFFTTLTPINDLKISDSYNKGVYYCSESVRSLTKITLTSLIAAKTLNGHEKKKTVVYHLGFKVSVNNRIEPVVSLSIPYTMNKIMMVSINLHPSKKEEMIKTIPSILNDFKILLTEHIDILLNKSIKLKKADILKLTLEDKMSYLPLVEMVKF